MSGKIKAEVTWKLEGGFNNVDILDLALKVSTKNTRCQYL